MANGQQIAKEFIGKFEAWVSERNAAGDWQDYIRSKNQLNRTEIAQECSFSASMLQQNSAIKASLQALEEELRDSLSSKCLQIQIDRR